MDLDQYAKIMADYGKGTQRQQMILTILHVKSRNTRRHSRWIDALLSAMVLGTRLLPDNQKNWCLCRTLVENETRGFGRAEGTAGEEVDAHVKKEQQTFRAALVVCVRHNN